MALTRISPANRLYADVLMAALADDESAVRSAVLALDARSRARLANALETVRLAVRQREDHLYRTRRRP
jgi:hypothetical protein